MDVTPTSSSTPRYKIICKSLPTELFQKDKAHTYFRKYGQCRVKLFPKRKSCIVEYDSYDNAQNAILNAGEYSGHALFSVNWHSSSSKKKTPKKIDDPKWVPDEDIQGELLAMAATGVEYKSIHSLRSDGDVEKSKPKKIRNVKTSKKLPIKPSIVTKPVALTSEQLEFLNTLRQPASTVEEKFKVLEARDKLMRLLSKKEANLTKSSRLVGTCPDMCPEKERLMREIQHQVSFYEQDRNGKLNVALAVKQYSRSSADQEVPLPHELRPVSVLQLTMGYLLHSIMNLSDANLTDWYYFLWDRTRGIRKDITQQELCCQGSVALIEQCARFHIHCSARLVAEDPSVFDQKINTENLTKCLQTLKYMYNDLRLKGESCPNEAEFRAYIILLNLNDGNFMWEVQQLKPEIQKSPEVKFALAVYSAIDKNNYVKFFKLVHFTNYLNACILLRYFIQVRTKALSTIVKSYSPRVPYTHFSLRELSNLLAFEDVYAAMDFASSYGLFTNELETHIILDRKNFQLPELPYVLERAVNVIESKRIQSVGEVVYGRSLPPPNFKSHIPHNSFKENGLFIMDDALNELIKNVKSTQDQVDSVPDRTELIKQPKALFLEPTISTSESPANIFKSKADSSQTMFQMQQTTAKGIFGQKVNALDQQVSSSEDEKLPKTNIFAQSKLFDQQPKPSLFDPRKQENIFNQKQTSNIFGKSQTDTSLNQPTINLFQQPSNTLFKQTKQNIFPQETGSIFGNQTNFSGERVFGNQEESNQSQHSNTFFSKNLQQPRDPNLITFDVDEETPVEELAKERERLKLIQMQEHYEEQRRELELKQQEIQRIEEERQKAEKRKLELERKMEENRRLEEERRLQEIKKIEARKLEEKKKREELRRLEEEKRLEIERKKRLEIERLQKIEEERLKALEKKRLLELEIRQSVKALIEDLLNQVEEDVKTAFLNKISSKNKKLKLKLFVAKWQKKSKTNKKKRLWMEQNPIWLPSRTIGEEAKELITKSQTLALENMKRYKLGTFMELQLPKQPTVEKLDIAYIYKVLLESYSKVHRRIQMEMFWKVTISLPVSNEFQTGLRHVEKLVMQVFQWNERYGTTNIVGQYVASNRLSYCIERKQGIHTMENNINGLLFIADEPNSILLQRIESSFKNLAKFVKVPIVVLFINNNSNNLNLDAFHAVLEEHSKILDYKILKRNFSFPSITNAIEVGLQFLASSLNKPPPLELDSLESFLHLHLGAELWKRISTYTEWNSKYNWCLRSPEVVVNLYNEAVEKLKGILLDESCWGYQDFPSEFKELLLNQSPNTLPCDFRYFPTFWKTQSYKSFLQNTINLLKLPKYQTTWPPSTEQELEKDIFNYCKNIFKDPQRGFYKTIAVILEGISVTDEFYKIENVLWSNIVQVLVLEKLDSTNFSLQCTEFASKSNFEQTIVVYDIMKLEKFREDDWFYLGHPLIKEKILQVPHSKKQKVIEKLPEVDIDLDEIERSLQEEKVEKVSLVDDIKEMKDLMSDLEESMKIQREIYKIANKRFKLGLDTN